DGVGYSDHDRFRGYVPVYCRSGLQPPCLRFAAAITGRHARLGTRLLARLCRDRHLRRLSCTHLQGTTRTDPDGPNSGIRFLPRVFDGETHLWPGVEVSRLREPVCSEAMRPFPREPVFLAAAPKRAIPHPYHVAMERSDRRAVRGNRVISEVASDDLPQPTSLFGYRLMHALAQLLLDLGELRPHAVAPGLTLYDELTSMRLAADEDKA